MNVKEAISLIKTDWDVLLGGLCFRYDSDKETISVGRLGAVDPYGYWYEDEFEEEFKDITDFKAAK